jgi:hypothetical protein
VARRAVRAPRREAPPPRRDVSLLEFAVTLGHCNGRAEGEPGGGRQRGGALAGVAHRARHGQRSRRLHGALDRGVGALPWRLDGRRRDPADRQPPRVRTVVGLRERPFGEGGGGHGSEEAGAEEEGDRTGHVTYTPAQAREVPP